MTTLAGPTRTVDLYTAELDRVIDRVFDPESTCFHDLVESSEGAFPTAIANRLSERGLSFRASPAQTILLDTSSPELHPLDFEWHFTEQSIDDLLSWVGRSRVNLIGLPSLAMRASKTFTLIERNPFVTLRCPGLLRRGEVIISDIAELDPLSVDSAPCVAFDPPWYYGETLLWLNQARRMVQPPGRIGFVLFPRLVRPSAAAEREAILSYARRLGTVTLEPGAVSYVTPRFEHEALQAAGVPTLNRWRRGDFVSIEVRTDTSALPDPLALPLERDQWRTYRFGALIVKLRRRSSRSQSEESSLLSPIAKADRWCYPSVSLREDDRDLIDLWTSRNRVAKVSDCSRVHSMLWDMSLKAAPLKQQLRSYEWVYRREEAETWHQVLTVND